MRAMNGPHAKACAFYRNPRPIGSCSRFARAGCRPTNPGVDRSLGQPQRQQRAQRIETHVQRVRVAAGHMRHLCGTRDKEAVETALT